MRPCSAVAPSTGPDEPEPPQQTGRGPQRGERPRSARVPPKAGQDDAGQLQHMDKFHPRRNCSGRDELKRTNE